MSSISMGSLSCQELIATSDILQVHRSARIRLVATLHRAIGRQRPSRFQCAGEVNFLSNEAFWPLIYCIVQVQTVKGAKKKVLDDSELVLQCENEAERDDWVRLLKTFATGATSV